MKRKTMGEMPLDRTLPPSTNQDKKSLPSDDPTRERATFMISADLMDRLRNMVFWTPGLTMSDTVDQVLAEFIEKQEKNVETDVKKRGEPFPPRTRHMLRGRPVRK